MSLLVLLDSAAHSGPPSVTAKGLTLFEVGPGVHQLRIQPDNEIPADGDWVFCLGTDNDDATPENFAIGDRIRLHQEIAIDAATDLMQIRGRFRQPANLPIRETIAPAVTTTRITRGASPDLSFIETATDFFVAAQHNNRIIRLEGAGITNDDYTVFWVESATKALLVGHPLAAAGGPTAVTTAFLRGAHWKAKVLIDDVPVFEFDVGQDGGKERDLRLPDLTANVSKLVGTFEIAYELQLVETP